MVSSTSLQYLYHFRMPFQWLSEHGALYLHLTVLQKTGQGSHLIGIILELHFKAQKRCLGGSVANKFTVIYCNTIMTKAIAGKVWVQKSEVSRPQHVIQENLWKLHLWTLQVSSAEKQKFVLGVAHAHDLFIRCWGHYTVPLCQNMPKHPIRQETMTTRPEQMLCGVLIIEAESTSASTATSGSGRSCLGAVPLAISCVPSPNHTGGSPLPHQLVPANLLAALQWPYTSQGPKNLVAADSTSNLLESSSYLASHLPRKCCQIIYPTSLLLSKVFTIIKLEIAWNCNRTNRTNRTSLFWKISNEESAVIRCISRQPLHETYRHAMSIQ